MLVCRQRWCGEVVAISGHVTEEEEPVYGEHESSTDVFTYYHPKSMVPAPPLFPVSKKLGRTSRHDLLMAFQLLWNDPSACANRLRIFIENLLTELGVPAVIPGKRKNLDSRISRFGEDHPNHMGILHALRHVGNAGSHEAKATFGDMVDCFMLVEAVIKAVVDKEGEEIQKIAEKLTSKYSGKKIDKVEQK
jgi:hypothetical protein